MVFYDSDFNMRKQFYEESKQNYENAKTDKDCKPKFFVQETFYIKGMTIDDIVDTYNYIEEIINVVIHGEEYIKVTFRRPIHKDYLNKYRKDNIKQCDTDKQIDIKDDIIDLGYVDDWKETPDIVMACNAKNHVKEHISLACYDEYRCEGCGYKYKIASMK